MKKFIQNVGLMSVLIIGSAQSMNMHYDKDFDYAASLRAEQELTGFVPTERPKMISTKQNIFQKCISGAWNHKGKIVAGTALCFLAYYCYQLYYNPSSIANLSSGEIANLNQAFTQVSQFVPGKIDPLQFFNGMSLENKQMIAQTYCYASRGVNGGSLGFIQKIGYSVYDIGKSVLGYTDTCENHFLAKMQEAQIIINNRKMLWKGGAGLYALGTAAMTWFSKKGK